ncbi:MAG: GNAT family N-acetyltransferase [Burkholderiales bacterium]|nr:GNAT family N-acetyltransferase [Phycisphaerae bacterium]
MSDPIVRIAIPDDAESIFRLIGEFAEFDGRPQRVKTDVECVRDLLAASSPPVQFIVAEIERRTIGFASFYRTFSTAAGECGLCLEDLFVQEASRRHGVGKLLMRFVAQVGLQTGCGRMEWTVGLENAVGIGFYESIGARVRLNTRVCRLPAEAMSSLAAGVA